MVTAGYRSPDGHRELTVEWFTEWGPRELTAYLDDVFDDDADVTLDLADDPDVTLGTVDDDRPDPDTYGDVDESDLYGAIDRFEVSDDDVAVGFRHFAGADLSDDETDRFRKGDKPNPPAAAPVDHLYVRGVEGNVDLVRDLYEASTGAELDGEVGDRLDELEGTNETEGWEPADLNELLDDRADFGDVESRGGSERDL